MNKADLRPLPRDGLDLLVIERPTALVFAGTWLLGTLNDAEIKGRDWLLRFHPVVPVHRSPILTELYRPEHALVCLYDRVDRDTLLPASRSILFMRPLIDMSISTKDTVVLRSRNGKAGFFIVLSLRQEERTRFARQIENSKPSGY